MRLSDEEMKILWTLYHGEELSTDNLAAILNLKAAGVVAIEALRKAGYIIFGSDGRWTIDESGMKAFDEQVARDA